MNSNIAMPDEADRMNRFFRPSASCQVSSLSGRWEGLFGRKTAGSFVEAGTYDGESFSNAPCSADLAWKGLCIELAPELAEKCRCRHARSPNVVGSDQAEEAELYMVDMLTTLSEQMDSTLARHAYALESKVFMWEFTGGFHVAARKCAS